MSDVTPNYELEIQRKKMEIANQEATIAKQLFDNMNWEDQIARNNKNIVAAREAIVELKKRLASLTESSGHNDPDILIEEKS
jgi:hypothetical protein